MQSSSSGTALAAGGPALEDSNVVVATLRKVRRHSRRRDQRFGRLKLDTSPSPGTNVRGCWKVVDFNKKLPGAKSGHLGHLFESLKLSESRIKELANVEKLEVAEITLQEARAQRSETVHVGWLNDAARGTLEDLDAVRNRVDATQVNAYDREDVVLATLPIKASCIILSSAATKPNAKDQHWSSSVGWRSRKAWYGRRETNKCCGIEIKSILMGEPVVDVPTICSSENHGYVTVRRGTDFFSIGSAAAPGIVERVQTAHFNTKIMPHIGPMVFGREMIEGHHLCRRRRRSPQDSEWESNSEHVDDMMEL